MKKLFGIISDESEDDDKWTWQPVGCFAVVFLLIALASWLAR